MESILVRGGTTQGNGVDSDEGQHNLREGSRYIQATGTLCFSVVMLRPHVYFLFLFATSHVYSFYDIISEPPRTRADPSDYTAAAVKSVHARI